MTFRPILLLPVAAVVLAAGCHNAPQTPMILTPRGAVTAANNAFLHQKAFDPWVLTSTDAQNTLPCYLGHGGVGYLVGADGKADRAFLGGQYINGQIQFATPLNGIAATVGEKSYQQTLDLQTGKLATRYASGIQDDFVYNAPASHDVTIDWPALWRTSDVVIGGDPEAQQVTHANLFYLLSSTFPGSTDSIPPMGLSSPVYGGHIFWDAEVWMLPVLIVQHPEYAKPIIDYRSKLLGQAKKNARAHGFPGAEYPWESAGDGKEVAPAEFSRERHITADVAFAAWQYWLWSGDRRYLQSEGWPLLQATADYWTSRVTKEKDGKYHIRQVLSPDETAGLVDDDAYTNGVVKYNLLAAAAAAKVLGRSPDPRWKRIADAMFFPLDAARGIVAENDRPMTDRFAAKQADTLLLIHPLGFTSDAVTEGKMLDFYTAHTIPTGPAMTSAIESVVAARLGRGNDALALFRDGYRPFERGPWDAFSEKRTTNNVYFLTGMAGCVQSVLYGFAGLHATSPWEHGAGQKLITVDGASLFCDPHLPPGWQTLVVKGVRFRGRMLDVTIATGGHVTVDARPAP